MRPFDETADGAVPGEGAVVLVLKRLDDALAAGDRVYAVIKGMGTASEGGGHQAVPTARAYAEAARRAWAEAGGNVSRAAKLLDVSRPTVYKLLREHGLKTD